MSTQSPETFIQANVNGQLLDARQPAVSPLDRGFLYGDALYEVWRSYGGVLFGWREHWERLVATAAGVGIALPWGPDEAFAEIRRTAAEWRRATGSGGDVYARLQVTRGGGAIGLDVGLADRPSFAIYVKAQPELSDGALDKGTSLHVARKWRRNSVEALPPSLKTGNYLNNILGLKEAREAGADDVLFLNARGALAEASTRNFWVVLGDRIATPPMSDGILGGVTRRILLESVRIFEGLPLVEQSLGQGTLLRARECFLTSTTQDVQPVCRVDEAVFPTGAGTVARRLKNRFQALVAERGARESALQL